MCKLKQISNKNHSKSALLRFLCRPFYAMQNRVQIAVEDGRSAITTACTEKKALARLGNSYLAESQVKRLNLLFESKATRRLVNEYVAAENTAGLYQLAQTLDMVRTFKEPISSLCWEYEDHDWIEKFPRELHHSLRFLSEASEDAERIAERLLAHDVPCRAKLCQELDFLRRSLEQGVAQSDRRIAFAERAADIDRLLVRPSKLSPARAKKLNAKIAMRATLECERTLCRRVRVAISRALHSHDIDLTNARMANPLLLLLVQHIHQLDADVRNHAWRLLKHAVDGTEPRWEEYSANRDFMAGLDRQGVDTAAWLDRDRSVVVKVPSGEKVTLKFTDNPLDYLLMGHHFSTCLSPDDDNFFSTIANAMDVNKQVLYARTADGRIAGRCLMAISTERELLIYQIYAHHWYRELCSAVKKFAEDLASDMNIGVATCGAVNSLVVENWYDDDPIDIHQEAGPPRKASSIKAMPPPSPVVPAGRLGAIDLSDTAPAFFVTLACDYHDWA